MFLVISKCKLCLIFYLHIVCVVTEERCSEVESLVFDLFANLGATGSHGVVIFLI